MGEQAILALAPHSPEHIYFTGRNIKEAERIKADVESRVSSANLTFIECDHLSLASVEKAAKEFLAKSSRLDVLLCNAGVMATEAALSSDGYENQFAVNHVAHALLIKLLLPTVQKTADTTGDARILLVTSLAFTVAFPGGILFDSLKSTQDFGPGSQWGRYGQSKLANILYAAELARRYPSITFASIHPGTVKTDIIGRLKPEEKELVYQKVKDILELHEGAYNPAWCATTAKGNLVNGEFYVPVGQLGEHNKESKDPELSQKLWTWTQKELEGYNL